MRGTITRTTLCKGEQDDVETFLEAGHVAVLEVFATLANTGPKATLSFELLTDDGQVYEVPLVADRIQFAKIHSCVVAGAPTRDNRVHLVARSDVRGEGDWGSIQKVLDFYATSAERGKLFLDISNGPALEFLPVLADGVLAIEDEHDTEELQTQDVRWNMSLNVWTSGPHGLAQVLTEATAP